MESPGAPADDKALVDAENLVSLGSEMRQVRKARRLTLKGLSAATGLSVSHISAIERSATSPSIAAVKSIARALDIDPDWFFAPRPGAGPMERAYVVRKRNRRDLNRFYGEDKDQIGLSDALLSSSIAGDILMGVAEYAPYSESLGRKLYKHAGEQHGLIVEGEIELQIDNEFITLREGDSYSFPTEIIHNARNMTDRPAKMVWAMAPIVIPKDTVISPPDTADPDEAPA